MQIRINFISKVGFLFLFCLPFLAYGQVSEKHVTKISRYMEKFRCYSDSLIVSMEIADWRDMEILNALTDLTHQAYLHSFYISGMLDNLTRIEDKSERASAMVRTTFYIKAAIQLMKITNKAISTELHLTTNRTVTEIGTKLKKDAEKFTGELETVRNDLEYDYTYNVEASKN